jgi:hypothetical protein
MPFCAYIHVNITHTQIKKHILLFQFQLIPFWSCRVNKFIMFLSLQGPRESSSANPDHSLTFTVTTNAAYLIDGDLSSHPAPRMLQRKDHPVHLITAPNLVLQMQLTPNPLHK